MNFLQLNKDKQVKIINAGFKNFALKGYKKASAMDIAKDAGISKAMIFHYFGSKKDMYAYLITYAHDTLNDYVYSYVDKNVTDIFDMISLSTIGKIEACGIYPFILSFIASVFKEEDPEIETVVKAYIKKTEEQIHEMVNWRLDYSRFREDIDKQTALKIMSLTADGVLSRFSMNSKIVASEQMEEYKECMLALKSILYKNEEA